MLRTQIYLTPNLHRAVREEAFQKNTTASRIIRDLLEKKYDKGQKKLADKSKNIGDWLILLSKEAKQMKIKAPSDLASNLDNYLYGQK